MLVQRTQLPQCSQSIFLQDTSNARQVIDISLHFILSQMLIYLHSGYYFSILSLPQLKRATCRALVSLWLKVWIPILYKVSQTSCSQAVSPGLHGISSMLISGLLTSFPFYLGLASLSPGRCADSPEIFTEKGWQWCPALRAPSFVLD